MADDANGGDTGGPDEVTGRDEPDIDEPDDAETGGSGIAIGIAIGSAMGVALGTAMDDLALGIAIGMGLGVALGAALEQSDLGEGEQ